MDKTAAITEDTSNRNYPLPVGPWKYYQEWHQVLFLHWKIDAAELLPYLPPGLEIDMHEGQAWISLVPFSVRKMKLRGLPVLPYFSEFEEINLRTYVIKDNVPGIYMFSIETNKL
ncbi:MAG TPA: DUF2071 domain-containing protein, partial [Flavobacterium sp.]|nr:DUF2071 domain-containing protein [Flavobacterium sp.]